MHRNSRLPPESWAPGLIETLLAEGAPPELADELGSIISEFHPAATRTALTAFAEADLRELLPEIAVPTLPPIGRGLRWERVNCGGSGRRQLSLL